MFNKRGGRLFGTQTFTSISFLIVYLVRFSTNTTINNKDKIILNKKNAKIYPTL